MNVPAINVPPLPQQWEGIPFLVQEFPVKTCGEMDMPPMEIDPLAMAYLTRQPWQGNIRELLNYVRRLTVFSNGQTIDLPLIQLVDGNLEPAGLTPPSRVLYKDAKQDALNIFSKDYLTRLLRETKGNISETSRISGLERASIQKIIKRLDLDITKFRNPGAS